MSPGPTRYEGPRSSRWAPGIAGSQGWAERHQISTSFLDRLPREQYRRYLPLFPLAVERFDLDDVRAHVAEELRGVRAEIGRRQIDDADVLQNLIHRYPP